MPVSPITGGETVLIKKIPTDELVAMYRDKLDIDVRDHFSNLQFVELRECRDTQYRFFYPFSVSGRETLYSQLQEQDWFYKHEKWEYSIAAGWICREEKILDIGCGVGNFLELATSKGADAVGLEFNPSAVQEGQKKGRVIHQESIENFALSNFEAFDLVVSFQVLEHVTDIKSFVSSALSCLKRGGKFIVGVPNNAGFLRLDEAAPLNLPPHHMGLWEATSLRKLADVFNMSIDRIEYEPLAETKWFQAVLEQRFLPKGIKAFLYHKLGGAEITSRAIESIAPSIHGHTVLVSFVKV